MDTSAIISRLEELKELEFTMELNQEFTELTQKYHALANEEEKAAKKEEGKEPVSENIVDEESPEEVTQVEEVAEEEQDGFKDLAENFKAKRAEFFKKRDEEEAKNLAQKKVILSEIRNLIQNEENIGKAFGTMNELRDKWNEIGNISKKIHHEIQQEYSLLVEEFYYNINIYKALQENDLKRNLQRKKEIIVSLKNLEKEENIKTLEGELRFLQNEWENIGPTRQEDWEEVKTSYWDTVKELYGKIKGFYITRREASIQNLALKAELIKKLKTILERSPESHKHWENQTKSIVEIQKEWKEIGFGPREENEKLWKEFRAICDDFFNAKRDHYKERNKDFIVIKEAKDAIIAQVAELKTSDEWKNAADKIKRFQSKWRDLGNAGPKWEQKLWKSFRSHCDDFFNARQAHFAKLDEENEANLKLKEALTAKIKSFKPKGEPKEIVAQLKEFSKEYGTLGNVPFKEKDRIYKAYKAELDAQYDAIEMDPFEKKKMLFEARLETILGSDNAAELLSNEREKIRKLITKANDEAIQLENNLGFFGKGSENSPLVLDVKKKIEKAKQEVEKLKMTLKQIPKI